jgi:hypothetical protein
MKLLTCPFCDALPSIDSRQSGAGYWVVACKNSDCGVKVEALARDRDKALQRWNSRQSVSQGL